MFDAEKEAEIKKLEEENTLLSLELTLALCGLIALRRILNDHCLYDAVETATRYVNDASHALQRDPLPPPTRSQQYG